MLVAVTREVSEAIDSCELTHLPRTPIDVELARAQHRAYEAALEQGGCTIVRVNAAPRLPDAVFVEDVAVVFDEVAVITRPGAISRRSETSAVADVLARYRPLQFVRHPATIDGGDVLVAGRAVFIGLSRRTNEAAVAQMRRILEPHGYEIHAVRVIGCLHLKSAVTAVADDRLLINPMWVARDAFSSVGLIEIDPREPAAANVLRVGGKLISAERFPHTVDRLSQNGFAVCKLDMSELAKAEAAVTCCSLIFPVQPHLTKP